MLVQEVQTRKRRGWRRASAQAQALRAAALAGGGDYGAAEAQYISALELAKATASSGALRNGSSGKGASGMFDVAQQLGRTGDGTGGQRGSVAGGALVAEIEARMRTLLVERHAAEEQAQGTWPS